MPKRERPPVITVDTRGHDRLPQALQLASTKVIVDVSELDYGDVYFMADTGLSLGVEYKTIQDFLSSWMHKSGPGKWRPGRLMRQLRNLKRNRDIAVLLLEWKPEISEEGTIITHWTRVGGRAVPNVTGWKAANVMTAFLSWNLHGIIIPPPVQNIFQAGEVIAMWVQSLNKKRRESLAQPIVPITSGKYLDADMEQMVASLMCIPEIGEKTAVSLITRFKSWRHLAAASIKDIQEISGVGLSTARTVYKWVNEDRNTS